ncbi:MAG TPA: cold shock domain-containing protein [Sphingomicrobium sp.]|nr:cold shock domain-containing protein [Sphingomicrobium sp.]
MQRLSAETTQEVGPELMATGEESLPEGQQCTGRVKWFDATRGFGFLVSDDCEGDILVHFSVLKEHGRRSLPEGATVECIAEHQDRGFQARKILSIDLSTALPMPVRPVQSTGERADRRALADAAGDYEPVEVKWFNRVKGYGFLNRAGEGEEGEDIFVHMETVRQSQIVDLQPGQQLEARIAEGRKGLTAVELREI